MLSMTSPSVHEASAFPPSDTFTKRTAGLQQQCGGSHADTVCGAGGECSPRRRHSRGAAQAGSHKPEPGLRLPGALGGQAGALTLWCTGCSTPQSACPSGCPDYRRFGGRWRSTTAAPRQRPCPAKSPACAGAGGGAGGAGTNLAAARGRACHRQRQRKLLPRSMLPTCVHPTCPASLSEPERT